MASSSSRVSTENLASGSAIVDRIRRLSVTEYFQYPETNCRMELVYGVVREPPAPRWGHQTVVTRLVTLLEPYVRAQQLGRICVSPVDVVLDAERALVVQPDLVFVSNERMAIVRERAYGAPDLTIEVLSFGTAFHDRSVKLEWYREYGVRECWLIDPVQMAVEVVNLDSDVDTRRTFDGRDPIESYVLPGFTMSVGAFFL
jgi:Uma2 family endonuclease